MTQGESPETREGTTDEIAELLGLSGSTLRSAKSKGKLPVRGNGWAAEPTGQRRGKSELWRAWREG